MLVIQNTYAPLQVGKTRFHKSHAFDYNRDVPVFVGEEKPGIGKSQPSLSLLAWMNAPRPSRQVAGRCRASPPRRTAVSIPREWVETSRRGWPSTDRWAGLLLPAPSSWVDQDVMCSFLRCCGSTPTFRRLCMRSEKSSTVSAAARCTSTLKMTPSKSTSPGLRTLGSPRVSAVSEVTVAVLDVPCPPSPQAPSSVDTAFPSLLLMTAATTLLTTSMWASNWFYTGGRSSSL